MKESLDMKTQIKKKEGLKREIELVIPETEVERSYSKVWGKLQKKAKMQGFRQGKVPLDHVKKAYVLEAHKEVTDELFKSFYPEALKELKLNPVSSPTLKDLKLEEKKEALFLLEIELHPEVKVKNYKLLEIKKEDSKITDKDVEETLKKLQQASATKDKEGKETLPPIDDELAKKFKVNSLIELKRRIREDMTKQKEAQVKEKMENDIIDELVKKNPLDLPEALVQDQKMRLKDNAKKNLMHYKLPSS